MSNEMIINATDHETRVALIEKGAVAELYIERVKDKGIVGNVYKGKVVRVAQGLSKLGYHILSTKGTAAHLEKHGIQAEVIHKLIEGHPHIGDKIRAKEIALIINTPTGKGPMLDEAKIRSLAVSFRIPCITTINAAQAVISAVESFKKKGMSVKPLQEYQASKAMRDSKIYV